MSTDDPREPFASHRTRAYDRFRKIVIDLAEAIWYKPTHYVRSLSCVSSLVHHPCHLSGSGAVAHY
jgi:hypothetical protein